MHHHQDYDHKQWSKHYVLGIGPHGQQVYFATSNIECAAVKSAQVQNSSGLQRERKILHELQGSPYVVQCLYEDVSVEYGKKTYNILLEYAPAGTLRELILSKKVKFSETEIACYTYQLLMAIRYVHIKGIFHSDINPSNILVFPSNILKLADFGSALCATEVSCEIHMNAQMFDICSIGCVVIKMIIGDSSWSSKVIEECQSYISSPPATDYLNNLSEIAKDFIRKCLGCDPRFRITVDRLIQHPFIQNAIIENIEVISKGNSGWFSEDFNSEKTQRKEGLFSTSNSDEKTQRKSQGDEIQYIEQSLATKADVVDLNNDMALHFLGRYNGRRTLRTKSLMD